MHENTHNINRSDTGTIILEYTDRSDRVIKVTWRPAAHRSDTDLAQEPQQPPVFLVLDCCETEYCFSGQIKYHITSPKINRMRSTQAREGGAHYGRRHIRFKGANCKIEPEFEGTSKNIEGSISSEQPPTAAHYTAVSSYELSNLWSERLLASLGVELEGILLTSVC